MDGDNQGIVVWNSFHGHDPPQTGAPCEPEEYAQRHGKDAASALDEALGAYLEWERQDSEEAIEGIRKGHEDVMVGRSRPASEFLAEMRR